MGAGVGSTMSQVLDQVWDEVDFGLAVIDREWVYRYVNAAGAQMFGRAADDMVGRRYQDLFPLAEDTPFGAAYSRVMTTRVAEVVDRHFEPWGRWYRNRILPCDVGIAILFADVTDERRHASGEISDVAVLSQLVSRAPVGVTVKDAEGHFLYANGTAARQAGVGTAEMVGRTALDLLPPEVAAARHEATGDVARTRRVRTTEETITEAGSPRTYLATRFPVYEAGGTLLGVAAIHTDISEQKHAERELADSRVLYRDMFAGTTLGQALMTRRTHRVLECNEAFAALLAASVPQVLAMDSRDMVVDLEGWTAGFEAAAASGRRAFEVEGELRRFDGRPVPVLASVTLLRDGSTASMIVRDLSPLRELQARLVESERLEAVGSVAGGIAHDVNNVLAAVGGYADLLEPHLPSTGAPARHLAGIQRAVARAGDLVDRLLAFARRQDLEPTTFDLAGAVHDLTDMCRRLLPDGVGLDVGRLPPLPVRADHSQVQQVLLNLVLNARDALPDGGSVGLTGGVVHGGVTEASAGSPAHGLPAGRYAAVHVSDDGVGMDELVLRRCFEPFFTTRHGRGGHGLGLSTAFGIARQSRGDLRVRSSPGAGSTFTLLLPLAADAAAAADVADVAEAARSDGAAAPGGARMTPTGGAAPSAQVGTGPTTLVVDDDPDVLDVVASTLRAAGHTVVEARDGDHALLLARAMGPSLDLVVSDVHMPGTDGRGLRDALAQERPDVPVLLVSGRGDVVDGGDGPFLAKPFRPGALLDAVEGLLRP